MAKGRKSGPVSTSEAEGKKAKNGKEAKDGPPGGNKEKKKTSAAREWAKSLLLAFVLFLFIRTFLTNTVVIISGSMEDTLLIGDFLIVNRAAIGSRIPGTSWRIPGYSKPERGDILVFDPHHEEDMKLVKRLMGVPGDTLAMRDKQLYLNGEPLSEPYVRNGGNGEDFTDTIMSWQKEYLAPGVDSATYAPTRDTWGPLVVPDGYYFMMGDNRDSSYDSRYWGLLAQWRIEGRPSLVYFSYNQESLRPFPWLREIRWGRIFHRVR